MKPFIRIVPVRSERGAEHGRPRVSRRDLLSETMSLHLGRVQRAQNQRACDVHETLQRKRTRPEGHSKGGNEGANEAEYRGKEEGVNYGKRRDCRVLSAV